MFYLTILEYQAPFCEFLMRFYKTKNTIRFLKTHLSVQGGSQQRGVFVDSTWSY